MTLRAGGIVRLKQLGSAGLAAALMAGCFGSAKAEPPPAPADPATPVSAVSVEEVVVTGSHIPRPGLASVSPVTAITESQVAAEGVTRTEDLIRRLPQAYTDQSSEITNTPTGTATVDLRQLGAERTLVLLDGKRLMPGDPTSGSVAPDLNFVPVALIDRVEVVTGGASAVYGSDAVAGVVNILLNEHMQGLRLNAQGGFFDHVNGDAAVQSILSDSGVSLPPRHVDDGPTYSLDVAAGLQSPDGSSGIEIYGGYRHSEPVTEDQRDFSACFLEASGDERYCQGSPRSPALGRFFVLDPSSSGLVGLFSLDPGASPGGVRPFNPMRDAFNSAPFQYLQRQDARWTGGAFGRLRLSDHAQLYLQGMFMDDRTTAQLGPSGLFNSTLPVSCSNPLLSAAEVQAFCTNLGLGPADRTLMNIGRRNVEGGPRRYELGHRDWRALAGVKGEAGPWSYDLSVQYSAVRMGETVLNEVSVSRANEAMDVVRNGAGQLVCASGAQGCAPYDVFAIGAVTSEALDFISVPAHAAGATGETVLSALVTGQLGKYGLQSPWAGHGLAIALGAEYRRESLSYVPDAELASGDLASSTQAEPPVSGAFHVAEVYGELRAPLAEDSGPGLHALDLEGGVRYSRYSAAGTAWTYKAGAEWAPSPDFRLRASFNHAVRAPNAVDLFTPQTINFGLDDDPCAGSAPAAGNPLATPANCARTGVAASQYGGIVESVLGYNSLNGGNPELKPESADTLTAGAVLTPRRLPGLSLTADWFDIKVKNVLGAIGADQIVEQCLSTGDDFFCRLIHRAPGTGSLWLGDGYVSDIMENTASMRARGVDVELDYRRPLPPVGGRDLGQAELNLVGSYVLRRSRQTTPIAPTYDCAGLFGPICGQPMPTWRHVLRLSWTTPWSIDLDAAWRYVGPARLDLTSTNPVLAGAFETADARLPARSYFDLSAAWRLDGRLTLRLGVNNLLDKDPPLIGFAGGLGNGNTWGGLYDSLGRYVYSGLSARF